MFPLDRGNVRKTRKSQRVILTLTRQDVRRHEEGFFVCLQIFPVNHPKQLGLYNHHQDVSEDSILDLEQGERLHGPPRTYLEKLST